MYCMECGTKLPEGAKFCMNCGTKVIKEKKPASARGCKPGKKYTEDTPNYTDRNLFDIMEHSYLKRHGIIEKNIVLDDGTTVFWVPTIWDNGHASNYEVVVEDGWRKYLVKRDDPSKRYSGLKDISLYRVDPDGTTEYLNAGYSNGEPRAFFIMDGVIYWCDYDCIWYCTGIYDDKGAETIGAKPEWLEELQA